MIKERWLCESFHILLNNLSNGLHCAVMEERMERGESTGPRLQAFQFGQQYSPMACGSHILWPTNQCHKWTGDSERQHEMELLLLIIIYYYYSVLAQANRSRREHATNSRQVKQTQSEEFVEEAASN